MLNLVPKRHGRNVADGSLALHVILGVFAFAAHVWLGSARARKNVFDP